MIEHKTMNTVVHAAFRRDLARFERAFQELPAGAQARASKLKTAWDWLSTELHHHHSYEETYFWPSLQQTDAKLPNMPELDREHQAMREALAAADLSVAALATEPTADHAQRAQAAVAQLAQVLNDHLEHEERELEPISAAYAKTPPMKAAEKAVIKAHKGRLGNVLAWLQDGATDNEKRGLRKQIPPPVVFFATAIGGRDYRRDIAPVWSTN